MSTIPPALSTPTGWHSRAPVVRPVPSSAFTGPHSRNSNRAVLLRFVLTNYPSLPHPFALRTDLCIAGGLR
jgi:hypothetical protein